MRHYAGIDLSMETSHVCVVDADGRKVATQCVDSTPEAIAAALKRYGPVDRAVIETGRMTPSIALGSYQRALIRTHEPSGGGRVT